MARNAKAAVLPADIRIADPMAPIELACILTPGICGDRLRSSPQYSVIPLLRESRIAFGGGRCATPHHPCSASLLGKRAQRTVAQACARLLSRAPYLQTPTHRREDSS